MEGGKGFIPGLCLKSAEMDGRRLDDGLAMVRGGVASFLGCVSERSSS